MSKLTNILQAFLALLIFLPYVGYADNSAQQLPISALERQQPRPNNNQDANNTTNRNCVTGQCPPSSTAPRHPSRQQPVTLTPKTALPQADKPIQSRPEAKFIPPVPSDVRRYESQQLLLLFPDRAIASTRIREIAAKHHLSPIARHALQALNGELVSYRIAQSQLTDIKKKLAILAPEAIVEFNYFYLSSKGPKQYFQNSIRLRSANHTGSKTSIGIVDTMVEKVSALSHTTIVQKSFVQSTSRQASASHGTNVALLIAGADKQNSFYGITPNSPLFVAGIMRKGSQQNNTNSLLLIQAIDWLMQQKVKVINLSLGGPKDAIMTAIFNQLSKKPVILVAAAGNSGPKAAPSYPAAYKGVIAVTASNANNEIYRYANQGQYIDITAPGEDVWVPNSPDGQYISGTSFSAAIVTGMVSQLILPRKQNKLSDIQKTLCKHALDLGTKGDDEVFGCGLVQQVTVTNE